VLKPASAEVVLDASALLALLNGEPGADRVLQQLPVAIMGAVNVSEAAAKLVEFGVGEAEAWTTAARFVRTIIPFDEEMGRIAAGLRRVTRTAGLSFGDRACLALAMSRGADVLTADRAWLRLSIDVRVTTIRP
jgi:PIN domain nuclease of toxin-antitoxin system